jgi:hypothetical protein
MAIEQKWLRAEQSMKHNPAIHTVIPALCTMLRAKCGLELRKLASKRLHRHQAVVVLEQIKLHVHVCCRQRQQIV